MMVHIDSGSLLVFLENLKTFFDILNMKTAFLYGILKIKQLFLSSSSQFFSEKARAN